MTTRYIGVDVSTQTGFVALDGVGNILTAKEITSSETEKTPRMIEIIEEIMLQLKPTDRICIEGFSYGSKGKAVDLQYGLGHGLRMELHKSSMPYVLVTPGQLKMFTGAKGNDNKVQVGIQTYKRWGFENSSDNITDAYVLAQISRALHENVPQTQFQEKIIQNLEPQLQRKG